MTKGSYHNVDVCQKAKVLSFGGGGCFSLFHLAAASIDFLAGTPISSLSQPAGAAASENVILTSCEN